MGYYLFIDEDKCFGCGNCITACPVNMAKEPASGMGKAPTSEQVVLKIKGGIAKLLEVERCSLCGICIDACPVGAIEIRRE
jgi:4Fe-4S ferredoxin